MNPRAFSDEQIRDYVKVRRIVQLVADLSRGGLSGKRVLDLGCSEGAYAIEAALGGAEVLALDAREVYLRPARRYASELGLDNLRFELQDVREVTRKTHGAYDIVFLLGLLYHLDAPDVFDVLEHIYEICADFVVIDTHVSLGPAETVKRRGTAYSGKRIREHEDSDSPEMRRARPFSSLDNTFSFWFDRDSLFRLLADTGFTTVMECAVPAETCKPEDRVTLVAFKGVRQRLKWCYPELGDLPESEIGERARRARPWSPRDVAPPG